MLFEHEIFKPVAKNNLCYNEVVRRKRNDHKEISKATAEFLEEQRHKHHEGGNP